MTDRIVINNEIINELIKLSITEYGNEAAVSSPSHLRWKYLDNPSGPTYADILYQDSQIVGRVVYEPRKFVSKDGSLRAVNPIDVLIDGSFRSAIQPRPPFFGGTSSWVSEKVGIDVER